MPGLGGDRSAPLLGEVLLDSGVITRAQLQQALDDMAVEGGQIGRHLILMGAATRREIYSALARAWDAPLIDLVQDPPDEDLLLAHGPKKLLEAGWVPWRLHADAVTIATSIPPTHELLAAIADEYGVREVRVRTTTDWDIAQAVSRACRVELLSRVADELADTRPGESAKTGVHPWQWGLFIAAAALLLVAFIVNASLALVILLTSANIAFAVSILFKTLAALRWPFRWASITSWEVKVAQERLNRGLPAFWRPELDDDELPIYTILIPAYNEENIVDKVLAHIDALDYPQSKLDVLLLLEEDDTATLEAARRARPPEYVRILVVPAGDPQTKPRACNYGMMFARGEFVVIYDAEDRPHPRQLRVAVAAFRKAEFETKYIRADRPLICVQASLNYFNADYNLLTRMFAIEYSFWFDAMLPGLDDTGIPLPLGGTSNHFYTQRLREIGNWDPYNVTEDADLGLRSYAEGYRVSVIDSTTWEEACSRTRPWIRQRTRWTKGYLVTTAVNSRNPLKFYRETGFAGLVGLFGLILGTPIAFLLYPVALGFFLITYIGVQFIDLNLPEWTLVFGVMTMVFGNLMMIVASGVTAYTRYGWRIAIYAVFAPVYWFMHAFAAWRALLQLITNPFHWEKTPHGLTEDYEADPSAPRKWAPSEG
ncbi:MAG: glycosyltransferase [Candidatus Nanopelagicales bacterium]|nr:glycosyltransferase [Candidatus Nanopelagicales bacterium]